MSEYQYYEFRAIDRPLTKAEMSDLRAVSSRGQITSTSFINEYSWGDFKGDPDTWMERYFDAFLYYANWGTKVFKLKLPAVVLSGETVNPYSGSESFWADSDHESTVLTFNLEPYDPSGAWEDYSGVMSSLIGLRAELAQGDLRCLYLGWLINRDVERIDGAADDDVELEPPVPAGLGNLTGPQQCLVDFFEIDADLLAAAASTSTPIESVKRTSGDLTDWITHLTDAEKDDYLLRVFNGAGQRLAWRWRPDSIGKQTAPALSLMLRSAGPNSNCNRSRRPFGKQESKPSKGRKRRQKGE